MTFAPASVRDNFSINSDLEGLCGTVEPSDFFCQDFSTTDAFLDEATGEATINLNWDALLVNTTLRCNFEYFSAEYNQVWVGDSFDVFIKDPCLSPISYTMYTSTD